MTTVQVPSNALRAAADSTAQLPAIASDIMAITPKTAVDFIVKSDLFYSPGDGNWRCTYHRFKRWIELKKAGVRYCCVQCPTISTPAAQAIETICDRNEA